MSLQNEGGGGGPVGQKPEALLLESLEKIRLTLNIPVDSWTGKYLGLTDRDYQRIASKQRALPLLSLYRLAEILSLNLSDLAANNVELDTLASVHLKDSNYINAKYTVGATSRRHTVVNALDYISKSRGVHLRKSVGRHFQIKDEFWTQGFHQPINIRFLTEFWDYLHTQGLKMQDFRQIGLHSVTTLKPTVIGQKLAACRNLPEIYEFISGELLEYFERNCKYRITHLSPQCVVFESISNREVADALEVKDVGSAFGCQVRAGILSALPNYLGMKAAAAQETRCVHRGDPVCRFVIDFSGLYHHEGRPFQRFTLAPQFIGTDR